ncbi:MAG: hypothetical protein WAM97_08745, partial [Acidimicrobiales bacterium]
MGGRSITPGLTTLDQPRADPPLSVEHAVAANGNEEGDEKADDFERHESRKRTAGIMVVVFAGYLALSFGLWWNVWSTHPAGTTTCACGDASLFLWFLEWPAYAIAHGHNPFFSTAMFHPTGVNLLSNTSVLAIGFLLAPVTWLFGPVATLNVACLLGPALNAVAMFWLLRRWVKWTPASLIGGLVFGFSPFVVTNSAWTHFMTSWLVLVPLIVGMLDEILVRQRSSPRKAGVLLGLLVSLEFFVGTEMLMILAVCTIGGLAVLLVAAWLRDSKLVKDRAARAVVGLTAAGITAVVLLSYPVWFALDGPDHLSGLVWPSLEPGRGGINLSNLWSLDFQTSLRHIMLFIGGYQGAALPASEYLGLGLSIVTVGGLVLWWRDLRLLFLAWLAVMATVLSLGVNPSYWVPWNVLRHIPVIQNIIPARFIAVTTFAAAAMLAIVLDKCHSALAAIAGRVWRSTRSLVPVGATIATMAIATVAVLPMGTAMASNIPLTATAAVLPQWFAQEGRVVPSGQVLLTYPAPFSLFQGSLGWQAMDLMGYSMAGGAGPAALPVRAGME